MEKGFNVGDQVMVTGEPGRLFSGEAGTILDVTVRRSDNSAYNVYWVAFKEKRVRMIGVYLQPFTGQSMRQAC